MVAEQPCISDTMANSINVKNPPSLDASPSYEAWEKALKYWQIITDIAPEKQGAAVILSLTGKAREAVFELDVAKVKSADGVTEILNRLGKIYKKDEVDTAYEAFERFIHFSKDEKMSMQEYINEFESRYCKAKPLGCELSDNIQGYFLLNQAGLGSDHMKLVRATITSLSLAEVKTKLIKVFGDGGKALNLNNYDPNDIKIENINIADEEEPSVDVLYGADGRRYFNTGYQTRPYLNRYNYSTRGNQRGFGRSGNQRYYGRGNAYGSGSNKPGYNGGSSRTKCSFCQSIFHEIQYCPEKSFFSEQCAKKNQPIILHSISPI